MKKLKIVHIGAGSGFVLSIARELLSNEILIMPNLFWQIRRKTV